MSPGEYERDADAEFDRSREEALLRDRIASLEASLAAALAELAKWKENEGKSACAWCHALSGPWPTNEERAAAITKHVLSCEKNLIRIWYEEADRQRKEALGRVEEGQRLMRELILCGRDEPMHSGQKAEIEAFLTPPEAEVKRDENTALTEAMHLAARLTCDDCSAEIDGGRIGPPVGLQHDASGEDGWDGPFDCDAATLWRAFAERGWCVIARPEAEGKEKL